MFFHWKPKPFKFCVDLCASTNADDQLWVLCAECMESHQKRVAQKFISRNFYEYLFSGHRAPPVHQGLLSNRKLTDRLIDIKLHRMIYLDVRTKEEFDEGHIVGAVHCDVNDMSLGKFPQCDKSDEIITYCVSGACAGIAEEVLRSHGFTHVNNGGGYADLLRGGVHWE